VEITHHRDALDDALAVKTEDEAEHAVGRGMLRSEVEDELFGDELVFNSLRGLELDVWLHFGRFRRRAPLVGLQLSYPPLKIFSRSLRMPSTRASGRGGQPGT
jgi:hypothetical protein